MKSALLLIPLLVVGCAVTSGGKGEITPMGEQKIMLSYQPSEGETLIYKTESNGIVQVFVEDYSQTSQTHSTSIDTFIYLGEDSVGQKRFKFSFGEIKATKIEQGEIETDETQKELEGEELLLTIGKDWELKQWRGLEGIGYDESGVDRGELIANSYTAFTLVHLPDSAIHKGFGWQQKFSLKLDTRKGTTEQQITKKYKVRGFTVEDDHNCAEIEVDVTVEVSGEGITEAEGEKYSYWSEGEGKGKGKVYFDYQNGYLYKGSTDWIIDFEITSESTSGETEHLTYSQETKQIHRLKEVLHQKKD